MGQLLQGVVIQLEEASNLASKFERKGGEGKLNEREIFLLTDNMVFESTFYKGHSSNKKLNEIVFRIRMVENTAK